MVGKGSDCLKHFRFLLNMGCIEFQFYRKHVLKVLYRMFFTWSINQEYPLYADAFSTLSQPLQLQEENLKVFLQNLFFQPIVSLDVHNWFWLADALLKSP